MPTTYTDTTVNSLVINKMTKEEYDALQNPSDTELYLIPDVIDATPTANSTNLVESGGVYNEVHPATGSSQPVGGMLPNVLYKLGTLSGSVSITLASPTDNTICNHYYFTFDTDSTAPTITWDAAITSWNGGSAPTISASKHYEISVLDGVATYMEV